MADLKRAWRERSRGGDFYGMIEGMTSDTRLIKLAWKGSRRTRKYERLSGSGRGSIKGDLIRDETFVARSLVTFVESRRVLVKLKIRRWTCRVTLIQLRNENASRFTVVKMCYL